MGEAELLAQHEGLADGDHRDPEDQVVADLGGLAGAGVAGVHDGPAHGLEDRPRAPDRGLAAADHEGEAGRLGARDPARYRRVDHFQPARVRGRTDLARGSHIDGRAIDQERARVGRAEDSARPEIDRPHVAPRRQHGDRHVHARSRRGGRRRGLGARRPHIVDRPRHEVEGGYAVARAKEVAHHRPTHVS